jgi:hypothetical protein
MWISQRLDAMPSSSLPQNKLSPAGAIFFMVLAVMLIGLGVGIGMIVQSNYQEHRDQPSLQWPKVTGMLIQCDKIFHPGGVHSGSSHSISATYTYTVNHHPYTGNQLTLWSSDLQGNTGNFAETHHPPCPVDVYYDPQNPDNAVLIPGPNEALNRHFIHSGIVFVVIGIAAALILRPAYVSYIADQRKM